MEKSAKYAYLLSTCHKFADKTFTKLIKKHEHNKVVCAKYQFSIWITLDIPKTENAKKEFKLIRIDNNFLNARRLSEFEYNILEELNTLTDQEKDQIKRNYTALIRNENTNDANAYVSEIHNERNLYTIINLVRLYQNKYKYIFIPCTVDYSQDVGLVHQCALLIDLIQRKFIFFDPYAAYRKYDHYYAAPVEKYLNIYKECFDTPFSFSTFHQHFIPSAINGIQNIILQANNAKENAFNENVKKLLDDIKTAIPKLYDEIDISIKEDDNPVNKTDKTIAILNILDEFEHYYPANEEIKNFNALWMRALELYAIYNSKTCVSITLTEMDALFSGENLRELYDAYESSETPNEILMKKINTLLTELYGDELNNIQETVKSRTICNLKQVV